MRRQRSFQWIPALLILLLAGTTWQAGDRRTAGKSTRLERGDTVQQRHSTTRSLEEMIGRVETVTTSDGGTLEFTHLREPVPYAEFMQAMAIEMGYTPQPPIVPTTAAELVCIPPDQDYDGDGFLVADELTGFYKGEYVADIPRVITEFENIWPGLEIELVEDGSRDDRGTNVTSTGLDVTTTTSQLLDFKNHFNSHTEVKLNFGVAGLKPSFSFDVSNTSIFDVTRDQNYLWKRDVIRSLARETTRAITDSQTTQYTIPSDAGFVKGDVYIANRSDYNIDIDVTDVTVLVVAFHPFTGHKYTFGFGTVRTSEAQASPALSGHLDWGQGVPTSRLRGFGEMRGILRTEIEPYLLGGWMFDMEVAGNFEAITENGDSVWDIQSEISQRTARLSVSYGPTSGIGRQYTAVSIFDEDGVHCITPRKALERMKEADPTANLRFEWEDDRLVLTAMNGLENRHTDKDFNLLTEQEKNEFGRWIVGYDWGPRNSAFGDIDLANTPIGPEDVYYFYYLTRVDLDPPAEPDPDLEVQLSVANDGTAGSSQLVSGDVSPGDVVELDLFNTFELHQATTANVGNGGTACGFLYSRTRYDTQISGSSTTNTVIPNIDYYGIQLRFANLGWRDLSQVLADAGAEPPTLVGNPEYSIRMTFTVQDGMTGLADHQPLEIRQKHSRGVYSIGYRGYNVRGQLVDCRSNETRGYRRASGEARLFHDLEVDADGDGSQLGTGIFAGTDPDDTNARIFGSAPEHLDGLDNDGDGQVDNAPMLCPANLRAGQWGTCRLNDGMGWYDDPPNILNERRWNFADGTATGWISEGAATEFDVLMLATDPAATSIDVRTTHFDSPGTFVGMTRINLKPEADLQIWPTGTPIEAEDGRLTYPMTLGNLNGVDFIHVPQGSGSTGFAEWQFDLAVGGPYRIYLDAQADDVNSDSFFIELIDPDGNPVEFAGLASAAHFQFADVGYAYDGFQTLTVGHTDYFDPTETLHPVTYDLQTGLHTLRIRQLEYGARLDKVRLERFCPDADGDGWTTCDGDCNDANAGVRPNRGEVCTTAYDDDCDGVVNEGCGGSCRNCPDITQTP